ncbi:MAG: hypothetical protein AAB863_02605 [Patescibacteria group bacterium]|mgnify:CR=1 FL=1
METIRVQHRKEQLRAISQVAYKDGLLNHMEERLGYIDQSEDRQAHKSFECGVNRKDSDCRVRG